MSDMNMDVQARSNRIERTKAYIAAKDTFRGVKKNINHAFSAHGLFLAIWYISAATVFILPLIIWASARVANKSSNYYMYANQYQQYNGNNYNNGGQYQQNQQYNNYQGQNQYNYNYNYNQQEQEGGSQDGQENQNQYNQGQQYQGGQYYGGQQYNGGEEYNHQYYNQNYNSMTYNKCKWYQFGCTNNYAYQQYPNRNEWDNYLPWWWMWAEDERRKGQQDGANPTLVVIYIWTLILLGGLSLFGHRTLLAKGNMNTVAAPLLVFANFSFLSALFLGGLKGAIEDDGYGVMKYGWYGQFGVLLYMTNMCAAIYGLTYYFVIRQMDAWKGSGSGSSRVIVLESRH
jgi:ABC-type multidrug transport system fused ATPase/permease subunit